MQKDRNKNAEISPPGLAAIENMV